jgi:cytochrome bd ubiquinol oxidase subunit I
VRLGAKVFRHQCSVCHTTDGANALLHLTTTWTTQQKRMMFAQLQRTKPFMPPFAGTPDELEALVQFVEWLNAGRPASWADRPADRETRTAIARWLDEAGTAPGGRPALTPVARSGSDSP